MADAWLGCVAGCVAEVGHVRSRSSHAARAICCTDVVIDIMVHPGGPVARGLLKGCGGTGPHSPPVVMMRGPKR